MPLLWQHVDIDLFKKRELLPRRLARYGPYVKQLRLSLASYLDRTTDHINYQVRHGLRQGANLGTSELVILINTFCNVEHLQIEVTTGSKYHQELLGFSAALQMAVAGLPKLRSILVDVRCWQLESAFYTHDEDEERLPGFLPNYAEELWITRSLYGLPSDRLRSLGHESMTLDNFLRWNTSAEKAFVALQSLCLPNAQDLDGEDGRTLERLALACPNLRLLWLGAIVAPSRLGPNVNALERFSGFHKLEKLACAVASYTTGQQMSMECELNPALRHLHVLDATRSAVRCLEGVNLASLDKPVIYDKAARDCQSSSLKRRIGQKLINLGNLRKRYASDDLQIWHGRMPNTDYARPSLRCFETMYEGLQQGLTPDEC